MPMANPFFVDPNMGRTGTELSGLANIITENRDKQAAIEQSERAKTAVIAAIQSNDPSQVAEASVNYPEYSDIIAKQIGAADATKKKSAGDFIRSILTASPDQRAALYEQRINSVEDPTQSAQSYQDWLQDPEGEMREMEMVYAGLDPDGYKVIRDKKIDELKEREFALESQNVRSQIAQRQTPKIPAKTTIEKNLISAGFTPGTPEFQQEVLKYIQKPSGTTVTIGDTKTMLKATEGQLAAAGFADRLANSNMELTRIEEGGYDPTDLTQKIATSIPGGNFLLSDEGQLYQGAKEDFITAVLRKESGAVIGKDEFEREDKKYFPRPGDSEKTILAKRKRRERQFNIQNKQSKGVYEIQYEAPVDTRAEAPDQTGKAAVSPAPSVAPSGRTGGVLSIDDQGNRAYVFPDGTFEEVQ